MRYDYLPFIDRMIDKYEGGYGWNRKDPGGPTKYGITCYDLAEHRHQAMTSMADWAPRVKDMSKSEAEDIYAEKYAQFLCFNRLPAGVDCVVLDYGVNSGRVRPVRVARALLGMASSSVFSTELLDRINAANAEKFIDDMCAERLAFMHRIRGGSAWKEFGRGWQARVDDLRKYAHSIRLQKRPEPATDLSTTPTPKATHQDPSLATKAVTRTATGTVTTGGGSAAADLPAWAIAAVIGTVIVAGVVWYVWKKRQANKADATVILPPGVKPQGA